MVRQEGFSNIVACGGVVYAVIGLPSAFLGTLGGQTIAPHMKPSLVLAVGEVSHCWDRVSILRQPLPERQ